MKNEGTNWRHKCTRLLVVTITPSFNDERFLIDLWHVDQYSIVWSWITVKPTFQSQSLTWVHFEKDVEFLGLRYQRSMTVNRCHCVQCCKGWKLTQNLEITDGFLSQKAIITIRPLCYIVSLLFGLFAATLDCLKHFWTCKHCLKLYRIDLTEKLLVYLTFPFDEFF